jgi:predicted permease
MLDTIWQDVRHGIRMLAKNPGFSLVAILSIAIGVGANTAMFSVADGLILRPLQLPDAGGLVTISATTPTGEVRPGSTSYPDYVELRDRARSFDGLAATRGLLAGVGRQRDQSAQGAFGLAVSANFFDVLRVQPALGRGFLPDEGRVVGRDAVVVLAHDTWTEQFGSDPGLVGQQVRLTGQPFTVVGIAPEGFTGAEFFFTPAFYVPLAMLPALEPGAPPDLLEHRDVRNLKVLGRLASAVTLTQADQEAALLARDLQQRYPDTNASRGTLVRWERDARYSEFRPVAALSVILLGLALSVLLVACANVAGLLTSRAPVRAREIALRLAIGGSHQRLMRQMITETTLMAVAGGAAGLALAYLGITSFQQFQVVTDIGIRMSYELDGRALAVGFVVAALSALFSSIIPAWRAARAVDLSSTLRNSSAPASRAGRLWGRHGLVASQVAVTLVLLTVALSFYRAFESEYGRGPGFRTDRLLLTTLDPGLARLDQRKADEFFERLKERAAAIPGITAAAVTSFVPLSQDGGNLQAVVPEGVTLAPGTDDIAVATALVDDDYLDTIGVAIVTGRGFQSSDTGDTPRVAVVSRGLAARFWPGQNPLGKRIRFGGREGEWTEIVGVAADVKFRLFTPASTPFLYLPRLQNPSTRATLVVRTAAESATVAAAVRAAALETGRDVPVLGMRTMEAFYHANARNLNTVVVRTIAGMGAMGLTLALIGLYGLTAFAVNRRTREIGIRMAMGALPASVLRLVMRQASLPAGAGIVLGVLASLAAGGAIESVFPNTGGDSVTFLLIVPAVIAVVTLATYLPARRAALIDPLAALRQD